MGFVVDRFSILMVLKNIFTRMWKCDMLKMEKRYEHVYNWQQVDPNRDLNYYLLNECKQQMERMANNESVVSI